MESEGIERRLAAILSADAVGYSRLMAQDEGGTIRTVTAHRKVMVSCIERARRKPTEDLNAYEAYQRGLYHFNRFRLEDMAKAKQGFERAIELDPNYASAISRLASVQTASAAMGWPVEPGALDRALELADRAQALEPSAHHVYVVRAGVHLNRSESREAEAAANQGFAAHDRSEIPALIVRLRRAGLP